MNHQTRVYNDVFEMLPSEENPSPMVRINKLNPSPEFQLYAKLEAGLGALAMGGAAAAADQLYTQFRTRLARLESAKVVVAKAI